MHHTDVQVDTADLAGLELSTEHRAIVQQTLPLVGSKINDITTRFYRDMFAAHPELLANTFNRGNQQQGDQQRALAASIATFASMLVDPETPSPLSLLSRIGHKHASLGITAEQYQIVHDHLMGAIVAELGADVVTAEVADAWDAVYWLMADLLRGFESDLYANAEVDAGDVFRDAVVLDRKDLPGEVIQFTIASADERRPFPAFRPGQYISIGVRLPNGARQLRQYSLVNDPARTATEGTLSFGVKRVADSETGPRGEVSNWLADNVQAGDHLQATIPFGEFVLDTTSTAPLVLISAGIGVTPVLGMLEYLAGSRSDRSVLMMHADRHPDTDAFAAERTRLATELANGDAITFYEDGESVRLAGRQQRGLMTFDRSLLPAGASFHVCGSSGFLKHVQGQLGALGIEGERVHYELFAPDDWLLGQ